MVHMKKEPERVFPAGAGVILARDVPATAESRVSRRRGGDPGFRASIRR